MEPIVADNVVQILSRNKSPGHDGIGNLIVKSLHQ